MAATTDHVTGSAFLLKADGSTVGGGTGGTLYIEREMLEYSPASASYDRTIIPGVIAWGGSGELDYLKSSAGVKGCGTTISYNSNNLLKLKSWQYNVDLSLKDRTNASDACVRSLAVGKRSATLSVVVDYTDPAASGADAESELYTAMSTTTPTAQTMVVTFGSDQTLTFSAFPIRWELVNIGDQRGETDIGLNIEFAVSGAVTVADTNADSGWSVLTDAVHTGAGVAPSSFTALVTDATADHSTYTGTAYLTNLSVSGDATGIITCSVAYEGDGSLTKYTYNT